MTSLTEALAGVITDSATAFTPTGGGHTDATYCEWLDEHGIKYKRVTSDKRESGIQIEPHDGRCWLCGETEGKPAAWIQDGYRIFKCFRETKCKGTFADLQARFASSRLVSSSDLVTKHRRPRQVIVDGLMRVADVINLIGGPKSRKSFWVMLLAICIASGKPFLGRPVKRGRVLLIDNELALDDLAKRMLDMLAALGMTPDDIAGYLDILSLRGKLDDLRSIKAEVMKSPAGTYSVIIVDALYKALPRGTDENSNSDMTQAYCLLDEIAEKSNSAVVVVHHSSKGSQHQKSVSDMGSGAGAQSRSADVHIVLRDHEAANTVVMQAIIRSQRPVEPQCLTFNYPLWSVAPDLDPEAIAVANKKTTPTLEAFLATISTTPTPKTIALERSRQLLFATKNTVMALVHEAVNQGLVAVEQPKVKTKPYTIRRIES